MHQTQVYYNVFGLGSVMAMSKKKKHDCSNRKKKKKKKKSVGRSRFQ